MGCNVSASSTATIGNNQKEEIERLNREVQLLKDERKKTEPIGNNEEKKIRASTSFKINEKTTALLEKVDGFLKSKLAVDKVANKYLPKKFMDQFSSRNTSEVRQFETTLPELLKKAESALGPFEETMKQIVTDAGLNPDSFPTYEGKRLPLTADTFFKTLTVAPLKSLERCEEKTKNEYGGKFASLVDIVRCSIVVSTEDQLFSVANSMEKLDILRLKNRFKEPLWNGTHESACAVLMQLYVLSLHYFRVV